VNRQALHATVAVTGLNATDSPAPGTGVIRCLRADPGWRGRIVGLAYDALDTAVYDASLVDEAHLIPYPAAGCTAVLTRLLEVHGRTPIDVLLPTLDTELSNMVAIAPELERCGIATLLPRAESLRLTSKLELDAFCRTHGLRSPPTVVLEGPRHLEALPFAYPIAVKGAWHGAEIARGPEEAAHAYARIRKRWGSPVLAQQVVEGEEYDVLMLGDGAGRLIGSVAMRKMGVTDSGKAWSAVTVSDTALHQLAERAFAALGWRGALELELIRDEVTGAYHLIEINPRFPAWCYLSVGAGANLAAALVRIALGETVEPFGQARAGVAFVRHAVDLICSLTTLEQLVTRGSIYHDRGASSDA